MGLDRPVPIQYVDFLFHAVQGDFGTSYSSKEPAMQVVLERLPATLRLTAVAVLFSLIVSIPLGLVAAMNHDGWIDVAARFFAFLGQSIPVFLLAILLMLVFAVGLRWLPFFRRGFVEEPDPARDLCWRVLYRGARALAEVQPARGAFAGVHPDGLREGASRPDDRGAARAEERGAALRHDARGCRSASC
jgi:ABC-type dipeptide/oligopeptide/nickel transport system permease component